MKNYYFIYLTVIIINFLASLTVYGRKENPVYLKVFPVFLLVTLLIELIALKRADNGNSNLFLYSLFSTAEFTFYLYFFSCVLKGGAKKAAFYTMFVYACVALANIFFIQGTKVFHTYTFMLGCSLIIWFGASYFFQLVKAPQTGKLTRSPIFWITSALMIYYCCDLPVFGILNYITTLSQKTYSGLLFVYNLMNIILYSLFTVAFLCRINIRKHT